MAHYSQLQFFESVRSFFPDRFTQSRVLEVGSLDINGSVRTLFDGCEYVGVDVDAGPGVDLIGQGQDLEFPSNEFDVTISGEVMEHNPFWVETLANMFRMTCRGGLVIVSCASKGRPEHGTDRTSNTDAPLIPWDYYKNLNIADLSSAFDFSLWFDDWLAVVNWDSYDIYFVALKKGADSRSLSQFRELKSVLYTKFRFGKNVSHYIKYLLFNFSSNSVEYFIRRCFAIFR